MKKVHVLVATAVVGAVALGVGAVAAATGGSGGPFQEQLTGYEEVPALSTPGTGTFRASVDSQAKEIHYRLTFEGLGSAATQAHLHFENATNMGPVVVFLCSNLGNGPAGTQACPANGGSITGTIRPGDIGAGATAQGLAAGEFKELVKGMLAGSVYVNVHSTNFPVGEIRAQLSDPAHAH